MNIEQNKIIQFMNSLNPDIQLGGLIYSLCEAEMILKSIQENKPEDSEEINRLRYEFAELKLSIMKLCHEKKLDWSLCEKAINVFKSYE